jgi:ATP-dependent exoDNAse (exonuclease V) alpha subunit
VTPERRVLETALRRSFGEVGVDQVHDAADRSALLKREVNGRAMVSTKGVLGEEQAMLAFAREGRGRHAALAWDAEVSDPKLNAGQRSAVEHVWRSHDRVMVIRGGAGTGKTTLMQETARGLREHGLGILPLAPTAEASRGVLRGEGFDNADTVARFLGDEKLREEHRGHVIWIDEAGILGTRDLGQVFAQADTLGCRVVLCGDTKQHAAVARGDALRLLESEAGIRPAEVTRIVRQKGSYRAAVETIAKGDVSGGFEQLDSMDAIREIEDSERHLQLAADYLETVKGGKTAVVVSPTHAEGERVTEVIRQGLREDGRLRGDEVPLSRLKSKGWTEAERSDAARFQLGQVVQFHRNSGKARAGERYRVVEAGEDVMVQTEEGKQIALDEVSARHFEVYEGSDLSFAQGDTLRITRNGKTADGKHRLNNGATYRLKGFDENGDLELDNGWIVSRDYGHVAHGYVTTSHASQGRTVDRVFIAQGTESFVAASQEQFYVSVSRARESVTVYTDDKEGLFESVEDSSERMSATELMQPGAEELATTRWDRVKAHAVRLQQWTVQARDYAGRQLETAREHWADWWESSPEEVPEPGPEPGQ